MEELRRDHRGKLSHLEDTILEMGNLVLEMVAEAMAALAERDCDRAEAAIRMDDRVDASYREVEQGVFNTLALQAPVATELRLCSALLHTDLHLERMGDLCVNIAKFTLLVRDFPEDPTLMAQLQEMGGHARKLITRALEAFARRDLDLVNTLPELDDPLDKLNKGLFRRLVQLAANDETRLDWAMRMVLVARYLERLGDHAVDIGEQVIFLVTGDYVELASNSPLD
jgi:phosphate transport system protein